MEKVMIRTDAGEIKEAIAPEIISASRRTDIPAFYSRWFYNRIERGYCVCRNPYNRREEYVSFKFCRAIVFWSKNPAPLIPRLHQLDMLGIHYYFQFTLNDYEDEGLEPGIPTFAERIKTFKFLASLLGPAKVIWRFDPVVVSDSLTPRKVLAKIWQTGNAIRHHTGKLVFSFVDIDKYRKVKARFSGQGASRSFGAVREPNFSEQEEILTGLAKMRERWRSEGWGISIAVCSDNIDFDQYGFEKNRCIDGELIARMSGMNSPCKISLPGCTGTNFMAKKDSGQRAGCCCAPARDIGEYNTCRHFCVYCYANSGIQAVLRKSGQTDASLESLAPS